MDLVRKFQSPLKPLGTALFCFASLSCFFVLAYIFVDYQAYVRNYSLSQTQEVAIVQQKTAESLKNLEKFLRLMKSRLSAAQGDTKRIQHILGSAQGIQNFQNLPKFEKVSFYRLTPPQTKITSFGESAFDSNQMHLDKVKEPVFTVAHNNLVSKIGTTEGAFEVQMPLPTFWESLGNYQTITLEENSEVFPFYRILQKKADSFRSYAITHQSTYAGLAFYLLFSLLLAGACLRLLDNYFQRNYRKSVPKLEEKIIDLEEKEKIVAEKLGTHQQESQNHQTSCQLQKELRTTIKHKRQEYGSYLVQTLNILEESYNPTSLLMDQDRVDMIHLCQRQAKALATGLWGPTNTQAVDLPKILLHIPLLFTEKIQESSIKIEIDVLSQSPSLFHGEAAFMEVFLINVIGKVIYRVPPEGHILISLMEEQGAFSLKIQDNGYTFLKNPIIRLKNTFDFFIEDDIFQQLCPEIGIIYTTSKGKDGGMNVTHIILPVPQEASASSNVVPLFH